MASAYKNNLHLNPTKTMELIVFSHNLPPTSVIKENEWVASQRVLGLVISSDGGATWIICYLHVHLQSTSWGFHGVMASSTKPELDPADVYLGGSIVLCSLLVGFMLDADRARV